LLPQKQTDYFCCDTSSIDRFLEIANLELGAAPFLRSVKVLVPICEVNDNA